MASNVLEFRTKGGATVVRDQQAINREIGKMSKEIDENKRKAMEFDRFVTQANRRNETAQERYNAELAKAATAFDRGKLSASRYASEVDKINKEMETSTGRFRQFSDGHRKSFGADAVAQMARYAAGLFSIQKAQQLITLELQNQRDIRDTAAAAKLDVSASRSVLIRNLVGASPDLISQVQAENIGLANRLRVDESVINLARAEALSASGGNVSASLRAVSGAAEFLFDRPSEIAGFAGSLLDLSKVTGTTDERVNLGLLTKIAGLSRVTVPKQQAANIPAALIGAKSFGATAAEAGALFSALTSETGDLEGRRAGTGLIALTEQLADFSGDQRQLQGLSLTQQIALLQRDTGLRQQFLDMASFEKKVKGPIIQLLSDSRSSTAQLFNQFQQEFAGGNEALARSADQSLGNLQLNRLRGTFDTQQALQNVEQRLALRSPDLLGTEDVQVIKRILGRTGQTGLASQFDSIIGEATGGISREDAAEFFERRRNLLLRTRRASFGAPGGGGQIGAAQGPSEEARENAAILKELADELRKLNRTNEEQLDELRNQQTVDEGAIVGDGT